MRVKDGLVKPLRRWRTCASGRETSCWAAGQPRASLAPKANVDMIEQIRTIQILRIMDASPTQKLGPKKIGLYEGPTLTPDPLQKLIFTKPAK